jgi:CDP-glucose 4,6-dehydratase
MEMPLGQHLRELSGPLFLTGHTGFKGTWMTFLLEHLNVPVVGYSLPAEKDSLFDRARRIGAIPEEFSDIRDNAALERFIDLHKPSTIIHMAAQPLVLKSYESPRETFDVNVMGTVNVLDIAFKKDFVKAIVIVTTDKVYRNENSGRPFIESDPLEGEDPYSASKVGTEAVVAAWQQIMKVTGGPILISVRAGNVIGGGDYAEDRLIPDAIRSFQWKKALDVRNPESTRPWQHVLEPLTGYIQFLEKALFEKFSENKLNFGPKESSISVRSVVEHIKSKLGIDVVMPQASEATGSQFESRQLNLDISKAVNQLNWKPVLSQSASIDLTLSWWLDYLSDISPGKASELCRTEIKQYLMMRNEKL